MASPRVVGMDACYQRTQILNLILIGVGVSLGVLGSGCRPDDKNRASSNVPTHVTEGVVARVAGVSIRREALEKEMLNLLARQGSTTAPPPEELRAKALENLVRFEVLHAKAVAAGLDKDPEAVERFRKWVVQRYENQHAPNPNQQPKPTEDAIRQFYSRNSSRFTQPAKVQVALLLIKVPKKAAPEKRETVMNRLQAMRTTAERLPVEQGFGDLARQHSEDAASRYQGGDQGWMVESALETLLGKPAIAAVSDLKEPGSVTGILEHPEGLCLLRLIRKAPASPQPLEAVRERIVWELSHLQAQEAREAFYTQEKNGVAVEVFPSAVEAVSIPSHPSTGTASPPRPPGG